ncbi:MAG: type II toxin-antitoxin system RelE family toxin [Phycisphaerales bacterium]
MTYRIELKPSAKRDLRKLPRDIQDRIGLALDELINGLSGDVKKLTNHTPEYRLRVGDYRVLFNLIDATIIIEQILHRKDAYGRS